jgi:hypothetical protein
MAGDGFDEHVGVGLVDVLGCLEALDQVELPTERKPVPQVRGHELCRIYLQYGLIDVLSVQADHVCYALGDPFREPCSGAASDVEHGCRANQLVD